MTEDTGAPDVADDNDLLGRKLQLLGPGREGRAQRRRHKHREKGATTDARLASPSRLWVCLWVADHQHLFFADARPVSPYRLGVCLRVADHHHLLLADARLEEGPPSSFDYCL